MTEKEAQENPAQPGGWAVAPVNTYPPGELLAIEQQKRQDTAEWEDAQNRSPIDGENPAQPAGFAVPAPSGGPIRAAATDDAPIVAKVFANKTARREEGSKVLLGKSQDDYQIGVIVAATEDKFWVAWRDGQDSVESKGDYTLIVRDGEE